MKTSTRLILTLASLLAFAGAAQAVTFTVSDITVGSTNGSSSDFKWSVHEKTSVASFDVLVGSSFTFTYGTFYTDDFSLDNDDVKVQNDHFTSRFKVTPPTPAATMTDDGYVDAYRTVIPAVTEEYTVPAHCEDSRYTTKAKCEDKRKHWYDDKTETRTITNASSKDYALVDFNNVVTQAFGNTGSYTLTFNDINGITKDGTYDLTATIFLASDVTPDVAPVPEPGTMILLGIGLGGLAIFGKRRMNKEA